MKTSILAAILITAVIIGLGIWQRTNSNPHTTAGSILSSPAPLYPTLTPTSDIIITPALEETATQTMKPIQINPDKTYVAILQTTIGEIEISLDAKNTPITVNNFVTLAKNGFYRNTIFHRIIKGFMIQGGDPRRDGTGDPGYKFNDEPITGQYTRGTVAMANSGPDTNGSQFFIMHQDYSLEKNYVIFGKVTKGIEVIDKIADSPVRLSPSGENSRPVNPASITEITILEK